MHKPTLCPLVPVSHDEFLKLLPLRELVERGYLPAGAGVAEVARFFGVTPRALTAFRHSRAFTSCPLALAAWLRVGELEARQIVCQRYQRQRFLAALANIRMLTRQGPEIFVPQMVQQCAAAGVAVVIVPEFKDTCVSGASKWMSPAHTRAMIQLSLRYKREDQFFFSLFHEAGHLLQEEDTKARRHEGTQGEMSEQGGGGICAGEGAADAFARDFLIPPEYEQELRGLSEVAEAPADARDEARGHARDPRAEAVEAFAVRLKIATGIVVGRLHHDGLVPWKVMAELKKPIDFSLWEQGQQAMWATWPTVTQAAELLMRDIPKLDLAKARARVSEAAAREAFVSNCRKGLLRRIEPQSLAAWRLKMRNRDLDQQDAEDARDARLEEAA